MAQYFIVLNLDQKEMLQPYWFGHGAALPDIGRTADGVMVGLAILLAVSGTHWYRPGPIYGRWAGDRIALVGDYYEGTVQGIHFDEGRYTRIVMQEDEWVDISEHVRMTLEQDWNIALPPPLLDGSEPRSILRDDGSIVPIAR